MAAEAQGDAIAANYLWGVNPVCAERADSTSYFLYNAHGDVVQLANENGTVTKNYAYDAFGNEKNPVSTDVNPFRYCGEYWDSETKTYYLRARYYAPGIGRFTQMDLFLGNTHDPLSLNLYTYCSNNPLRFIDPSGHWQEGDEDLPSWAYDLIAADTKKWEEAYSRNDAAGMAEAHSHAQAIRQYAARANTYNMMQFFGVSDPTEIVLSKNAMVFVENTRSLSVGKWGLSIVEGHTVVMDFDKYCEYLFGGIAFGPSVFHYGDIGMISGYVYNVKHPSDYSGLFFGGSALSALSADGGAYALNGVYAQIIYGWSLLGGSAGFSMTFYKQYSNNWIYDAANIRWHCISNNKYSL